METKELSGSASATTAELIPQTTTATTSSKSERQDTHLLVVNNVKYVLQELDSSDTEAAKSRIEQSLQRGDAPIKQQYRVLSSFLSTLLTWTKKKIYQIPPSTKETC